MRVLILLGIAALSLTTTAHAGDDPSIPSEHKTLVQQAMATHIKAHGVADRYVIYDAVEGDLLRLQFGELHPGVVRKGEFYVSCADFTNARGALVDVDFLVARGEGGFRVIESVVHKIDGAKRPYHIETRPVEQRSGSDE